MNEQTLDAVFASWWQDSYGHPPGVHAAMTHVAFGRHLLQLFELLQGEPSAATDPTPPPSPSCPC